ncbi:septum site-determining protein MinC [Bacillus sp. DNRA2]|uniref:septum site-determining protein MinC n=1 Tax=Bacillus sp. DNRA2 TaxID=2723053 RepID=UPI00145EF461|nr:septum site-determining protein MinC [Bacillus sp. DNRA2]NMD70551.1 septum site-determining protein MinC [Bacillus sp. DNRA2]
MKKSQNVTIKGTKDGITLHLDDSCSYEELKKELDIKLSANSRTNEGQPLTTVKVQVGNRYLTDEMHEEIKEIIRKKKNLVVDEIVTSVMTIEEAARIKAESEIVSVARIIRSGQVLEVPGDLLLLGDVNPGGTVKAGGNIFIMGTLKGIAHAGCYGDDQAVISAAVMNPSQLWISDCINRAPDHAADSDKKMLECAFIDENRQIVVDRIQVLMHLRPNLTRLEGGF